MPRGTRGWQWRREAPRRPSAVCAYLCSWSVSLLGGPLEKEQAEVVVGELAAVGEQEVGGDEATRAREAAAAARHLEDRRAVTDRGVGAGTERAARAERDRPVVAERHLARLHERSVRPEIELTAADCLAEVEVVGRSGEVGSERHDLGFGPVAPTVELDGLPGKPKRERDRSHAVHARSGAPRPAPWNYGAWLRGERRRRDRRDALPGEDARELGAVRHLELAVRAVQVRLDRAGAEVEQRGNLAVAHPARGVARDAQLLCGQDVGASFLRGAGCSRRSFELGARSLGPADRAERVEAGERMLEVPDRVRGAPCPAEPLAPAELDAGMLEVVRNSLEQCQRGRELRVDARLRGEEPSYAGELRTRSDQGSSLDPGGDAAEQVLGIAD